MINVNTAEPKKERHLGIPLAPQENSQNVTFVAFLGVIHTHSYDPVISAASLYPVNSTRVTCLGKNVHTYSYVRGIVSVAVHICVTELDHDLGHKGVFWCTECVVLQKTPL